MQYLTIDDFLEYGGQLEDEARFNRHEFRARMFLDMLTLGRIDEEVAEREAIRRCMYELIENYEQEHQQTLNGVGVSSVSNDGVSITYGSGSVTDAVKKQCMDIVRMYLLNEVAPDGTPLLFKGVTA